MFKKMMVCLDGSKLAEQILPYATEQAFCFNAKLILFQSYIIPSAVAAAQAQVVFASGPDIIQEEADRLLAEATKYLESIAETLKEKGLDVSCAVMRGSAGEAIISYAQSEQVDLIAIATHGHGGLGRVIFGSVADYVLRESGLPMLVVRPKNSDS